MRARFSERLDERVRIARELHDTLLQSFHGLMFQFQAARNLLPRRPESAMEALDEAILTTEKAIAERDAIQDLRPELIARARSCGAAHRYRAGTDWHSSPEWASSQLSRDCRG